MTAFCNDGLLRFSDNTFFQGVKLCMDALLAHCFAPLGVAQC
nr:hypothetical protein [Pantoea allii]